MRPALLLAAVLASACAAPPASRGDSIGFRVALADSTADASAEWEALPEATRARYRAQLVGGAQALDRPPFPVGGMAGLMANLVYPEVAIREGLDGQITVEATVSAGGTVSAAKAVGPWREGPLAASAVAAVRRTAFHPAERDGAPVAAIVRVPIVFRLE